MKVSKCILRPACLAFGVFILVSKPFFALAQTPSNTLATDANNLSFEKRAPNKLQASTHQQELFETQQYLEQKISDIEAANGVHHVDVSTHLFILAQIYREQGDKVKARNTFERSLEVHRMNHGLYDASQFAIVEELIATNRLLESWIDVNSNYEYLYWLHRRVYKDDENKLIDILNRVVNWKIEAIERQLLGDRESLAKQARNLANKANKIIRSNNIANEQGE
ncbi:tetratricopeptide repeat protein [Ningiella sp. W23]|uniref:tetratricopeptide repeat protein n=1 Tax=Ningiella sp. W23 TaxID=3023715 RepID=UPI003757E9B1